MEVSKVLTIMSAIGFPSIFVVCLWCVKTMSKYAKQFAILMKSQQAQMRNTLLHLYHEYMDQGYVTEEALENWENLYQSYHNLGKNGVLDARREQLLKLEVRH